MHAGQSLSLRRSVQPHQPHGPHGSPAPLQPLRTHAAHSHAHSPFIRSPPPLQSLAGVGRASLRGPVAPRAPPPVGATTLPLTLNGPPHRVDEVSRLVASCTVDGGGDFQLDLMTEGRIMPDLTDGMLQSRTLVDSEELM